MTNCHGCKWLDEVKSQPPGSGYCCQVVRSSGYNPGGIVSGRLEPSDRGGGLIRDAVSCTSRETSPRDTNKRQTRDKQVTL